MSKTHHHIKDTARAEKLYAEGKLKWPHYHRLRARRHRHSHQDKTPKYGTPEGRIQSPRERWWNY